MSRASLYREGARLPEQLSRLLFLEPVLQGRRVLEVGARSDAVARFLLELGAQRVVCASADKVLVDTLREQNTLEHVDFRVIRPGVLPGDDGAFDLVIDFSLADALAAGDTFRLTDIGRLLSEDGFAVTAIASASVRGLGGLLGDPAVAPPEASATSAAGLSASAGPVGYRQLVDALKLQFDLVQVYFQSLLLGYLFGSFDVEPSGDGVAPATALMGGDPEPAGHYVFAFGNAVPVIEDVALVQLPFSDLLLTLGKAPRDPDATITPTPLAEGTPVEVRIAPSPARGSAGAERMDESELLTLRRANAAQEHALSQIAVRTEELRGEVTQLLAVLDARTRERDELLAFLEPLEEAIAARDAQLEDARRALADFDALNGMRAEDDEDRARVLAAERAVLLEQIAQLEAELAAAGERLQLAQVQHAEAHAAEWEDATRHIGALEAALVEAERVRDSTDARVAELVRALKETRDEAARARADAEQRALEATDRGEAHARADALEARVRVLDDELAALRGLVLESEAALHAKEEQRTHLATREAELSAALLRADERVRELESEALKLADGVKVLMREREATKALLDSEKARLESDIARLSAVLHEERSATASRTEDLEGRLARAEAGLSTAEDELRSARERIETLQRDTESKENRLKAAHAALEEARRDLTAAREGLQEIAGQRDTLQHVLRGRERELDAARQQLLEAAGEERRLLEQADAQSKALGDARERLTAAEVERAHALRRAEELAIRIVEREAELTASLTSSVATDVTHRLTQDHDEAVRALRSEHDAIVTQAQREYERTQAAYDARIADAVREHHQALEQLAAERTARLQSEAAAAAVVADLASEREARQLSDARAASVTAEVIAEREARHHSELALVAEHERVLAEIRDEHERVMASQRTASEEARAELAQRGEQLVAMGAELARVREELERTQSALKDAERRLHHAEEEVMSLLAQVENLTGELAQARVASDERAARLERELTERIDAEQTRAARAEADHSTAAAALADAQRALDEADGRAQADALVYAESTAKAAAEAEAREAELRDALSAAHADAQAQAAARDGEAVDLRSALAAADLQVKQERARSEEARSALDAEQAHVRLLRATLDEAQESLARERARAEVLQATLHEARTLLDVERARGDLFSEDLLEAQGHIFVLRDKARAAIERVVHEADASVAAESSRAQLQENVLEEAREQLVEKSARVQLLEAELDDARATWTKQRAAAEAALDAERARLAGALGDAAALAERLRAREHDLAEERSNTMLLQASIDKHQALAESAERERDAVLGDLTAHQARAHAESARRLAVEEELAKLRVAHNQTLAEAQRLKLEAEAGRRAAVPEFEAQIAALTSRLEAAEKSAEQREAKIAEQSDLIGRLKDRLVRIQDQR